jgi:hypoxanthine phosphoribosyltransferase
MKSHRLRVLVPRTAIASAVARLASQISRDYRDKNPLLIGILKGSFVFLADLIRNLDFPLELDFIRLSSYGRGTQTSGRVRVVQGLRSVVKARHVLVIEDIVDTGVTVTFLTEYLKKKKPASLKLCALLDKPSRRRIPVTIDYLGINVPDKFLMGYGLDCDEKFRNLPDVCVLEE